MSEQTDSVVSTRRTSTARFWPRVQRQWLPILIGLLAGGAFLFGLVGFWIQYQDHKPAAFDWTMPVFRAAQLFLLNSGSEVDADHPNNGWLSAARIFVVGWFAVISAAVVGRIVVEFRKLPGRMTLKDHVIIAGLGEIGLHVLDGLRRRQPRERIVAIEADPGNPWLDHARALGAEVIVGDASRADVLDQAHADRVRTAFVVSGDDGVNLEVAATLAARLRRRQADERAQLHLHIADGNLAVALQRHAANFHDTENLDVRVFNVGRNAASKLATTKLWPYAPTELDEVAHFILVGFRAMGQALALQLARLGHFPNLKRSRFTIADADIHGLACKFLARYPRFTAWTPGNPGVDIFQPEADAWSYSADPLPDGLRAGHPDAVEYAANARFVEMVPAAADETVVRRLAEECADERVKPYVFVCGQEDRENFDAAIALREKLVCFGLGRAPVFVWMPRQPALADALRRDGDIRPFGECQTAARLDEIERPTREVLARTLHDDYEARAVKRGEKSAAAPWSDRDPFRESNLQAAEHLTIKLAYLGYELRRREKPSRGDLVEFDGLPRDRLVHLATMEHNRWMAERLLAGWRFVERAGTKAEIDANKRRKLHHDLIPWELVPPGDRDRDFEQIRRVLRACQNPPFRLERVMPPATENA